MAKDNEARNAVEEREQPTNPAQPRNEAAKTPERDLAKERAEKFPEFVKMEESLKKEREALLKKSEPHHKQRDELVKQIQPLENKLREVNKKIREVEQPRLAEIDTQLGRLAVAMGGRAVSQSTAPE